jgi:predicted pyridoxine 5'-phosphate oxidase superfamily flavin-nucleotide-binding protein
VASDRVPEFAVVIAIEEVFFHCPKCMIRSRLWEPERWPDTGDLASFAQAVVEAGKLDETPERVQALLDRGIRERLY